MKALNHVLLAVFGAFQGVSDTIRMRQHHAARVAAQRGSITLEQILWTVALAAVAIVVIAIVVALINSKAAELGAI